MIKRANKSIYLTASFADIIGPIILLIIFVAGIIFFFCYLNPYVSLILLFWLSLVAIVFLFANGIQGMPYRLIIVNHKNNTITVCSDISFSRKKAQHHLIININKIKKITLCYSKSNSQGRKLLIYTNPEKTRYPGVVRKTAFHVGLFECDGDTKYKIIFDNMKNAKILSLLRQIKAINSSIIIERDYSIIYE